MGSVFSCFSLTCLYLCRDLIRVLKWHVDRIIDAEHHEQIQQVLKVKIKHLSPAQMLILLYVSFKIN